MRRPLLLLVTALVVVLAAACGDDAAVEAGAGSTSSSSSSSSTSTSAPGTTAAGDGTSSTSPAPTTTVPRTTAPSVPRPPAAPVVLSIAQGGGFTPRGYDFGVTPLLVLQDGTVLTGGAVPAIYPGPAVLPVVTGRLSDAQLDGLLDDARAAGLDHDHLDAGTTGYTDAGTGTISVLLDGKVHTSSVYALGDDGTRSPTQAMTPAQHKVRQALSRFAARAQDLATQVATQAFEASAYEVLPLADDGSGTDGQPAPTRLAWPFPDLPLADGRCVEVDAAHTPRFREALAKANQATVWTAGAATFRLVVRPVLPVVPGSVACTER